MDFIQQSVAQPYELEEEAHFQFSSHNYIEASLKYYHLFLLQGNIHHLIAVGAAMNAMGQTCLSKNILNSCIEILEADLVKRAALPKNSSYADPQSRRIEKSLDHQAIIAEIRRSILSPEGYRPPLVVNRVPVPSSHPGNSSPDSNKILIPESAMFLHSVLFRKNLALAIDGSRKISAVIDRVDSFRNLVLISGWVDVSIHAECCMSLVDSETKTLFSESGSACFYTRSDVNSALGSPEYNRHGFSTMFCLGQVSKFSQYGLLSLQFTVGSSGISYLSQPIVDLSILNDQLTYHQFAEYALGTLKNILNSGTQWFNALRLYSKESILLFSSYFRDYIQERKANTSVHWLSDNNSSTSDLPKVSFIYVQLGEISIAKASLTQILQLKICKEVIIVNNSPEHFPETFHLLSRFASCDATTRFCIINCVENLGFSAACNIGAKHARGSCLFFHNNDLYAESAADYSLLIEIANENPHAIHSSYQYFTDGTLMQKGIAVTEMFAGGSSSSRYLNGFSIGRNQVKGNIVACSGSLMVISQELFKKLSGFSEEYIYAHFEDVDLCLRALSQGYPVIIENSTKFYHAEGSGTICADHLQGTTSHINRLLFTVKWDTIDRTCLSAPEYVF